MLKIYKLVCILIFFASLSKENFNFIQWQIVLITKEDAKRLFIQH